MIMRMLLNKYRVVTNLINTKRLSLKQFLKFTNFFLVCFASFTIVPIFWKLSILRLDLSARRLIFLKKIQHRSYRL